ncbi:MAG: thiamine pyrophosphate-dependent enzyme, partial [Chloroflexi bacterium]|nr:thiamine pyrophosphate-dependent enzyme [Chloroflexota bacterium]
YGGTTTGSDELWLFDDVDFAAIAESFGCLGLTVSEPSEIGSALERAFAAERPVVIDVKTAVEGIAPRAWAPK